MKFNNSRRIFLVVSGMILSGVLFAQSKQVSPWAISAMMHANLPQIPYFREVYFPNAHGGFGVYAAYRMQPKWDIKTGLKANVVAYSRNATDNVEVFTQKVREYYLELPISLYYYPSRTERTWGFYTGLTPSILGNKWTDRTEHNPKFSSLAKDPSAVGRFDLGIHVGASIKLAPRWMIAADYTQSLTSRQNEAYNAGKFSQFSIGIGFQINSPNPNESEKELAKKEDFIFFKKQTTVVLVRLKTEAKKIQYYRNAGMNEAADELQEEINEEIATTRAAFDKGFTFCQVYFLYDTSSAQIRDGHYAGVLRTEEDSVFTGFLSTDSFDIFIAEFGSPHSEAFGTESGFGLVIYDHQFNQMKDPFPYYTPTYYGLVSRKEVVAKFDRKLREYRKMAQ